MRSNYKLLGLYIQEVDVRNTEGREDGLLGLSVQKKFVNSKANTIGTDFRNYKVVVRNQFSYTADTSRRGDKIAIALLDEWDEALVSPIYTVFEITKPDELLAEYLMMWFRRTEFDRYARFMSHGSVRELFGWEEMSNVELPVPSPQKQREIVAEYRSVVDRIRLNERLNEKLEETAQAIYRHWFVDFEFPMTAEQARALGKPELEGQPYKSSGGEMHFNETLGQEIPVGWHAVSVGEFCDDMKSGGTPSRSEPDYWKEGTIPWLKTGEVVNRVIIDASEKITPLGLDNSSARLFPRNTVLIALYGDGKTKGQVGFLGFESTTNQACCGMLCESKEKAAFLFYDLRFSYAKIVNEANGGAQENLSKDLVGSLPILEAPADILSKAPFVKLLDTSQAALEQSAILERLRETILSKIAQQ